MSHPADKDLRAGQETVLVHHQHHHKHIRLIDTGQTVVLTITDTWGGGLVNLPFVFPSYADAVDTLQHMLDQLTSQMKTDKPD